MTAYQIGNRIRERRRALGLRQIDLAKSIEISPSYLNLIEHNRRSVGQKHLAAIAHALDLPLDAFDGRAEAALAQNLRETGAIHPGEAPEVDSVEELIDRFPGWAKVVAAEARRSREQAATISALADRYNHDPFLQSSLHEMLSTITAIRSAAAILTQEPDLPGEEADRFQKTVHTESVRLSGAATSLAGYFDDAVRRPQSAVTMDDALDRFLTANGYAFAELEAESADAGTIARLVRSSGEDVDSPVGTKIAAWLQQYREDARALPLTSFAAAAEASAYAPDALADAYGVSLHTVFRRLATLRRPGLDAPAFGLVIVNAAGNPLYRRQLPDFSPPRFASICALWPVFQALSSPGQPISTRIELANGSTYLSHAVALPLAPARLGTPPAFASAMLVSPDDERMASAPGPARPVGTTCQLCPRMDCDARSDPPVLPMAPAKAEAF